jgi:hypothetical protein
MNDLKIESGATFDSTGKYRFSLWRLWDISKPHVVFIMLNPSTANAETDDPTIRRCVNFAKTWGYGGLKVVNLFPLVSAYPKVLLIERHWVQENIAENIILDEVKGAGIIVAAWGSFREAQERSLYILNMLDGYPLYCLGVNKDGSPKHPLYIKGDVVPQQYLKGRSG